MSGKNTGGFGAAKPLPGQATYGMTEADLLEKQAQEMEARLKSLQQKMQETAIVSSSGGAIWKNARPEKGSVTSYAKDYQEKLKQKKISEKTDKATAEGRRMARKKSAASFSEKSPDSWNVADVGEWLSSRDLAQYVPNFKDNVIDGKVLMELSLQDLDYMGITALGHRKTILKGIEELNAGGNRKVVVAAPVSKSSDSMDIKKAPPAKQAVHWSQLEPIANNQVSSSGGAAFINPADEIDEEAERLAFQAAVMEWRNMGKASEATTGARSEGSTMWSNPIIDEDEEENESKQSNSNIKQQVEKISSLKTPKQSKGASLADGELDEERERAEFAAAVAAWRNAGKTSSDGTNTNDHGSQKSAVVEKLSRAMEEEHERVVARLSEEQEAARKKIAEAAREVEIVKQRKAETEKKWDEDKLSSADVESTFDENRAFNDSLSDAEDALSLASENMNDEDSNRGDDAGEKKCANQGTVVVSLIESTMGFDIDLLAADEKDCAYVVEEASDSEHEEGKEWK